MTSISEKFSRVLQRLKPFKKYYFMKSAIVSAVSCCNFVIVNA